MMPKHDFILNLVIADAKNIKEEKSNRKIFFSQTTCSAPESHLDDRINRQRNL